MATCAGATSATRAHPTARLEETQKLDERGVRVLRRHAGQQRLLGAGGRDLRELQAGTALQRVDAVPQLCAVCAAAAVANAV